MKLSDLASKMAQTILLASVIIAGLGLLLSVWLPYSPLAYLLGLVLGSLTSLVKVYLLDRAINRTIDLEAKQASLYMSWQYLLRLGLTALALVLGAILEWINLWGVVLGILAFQLAAYSIKFRSRH